MTTGALASIHFAWEHYWTGSAWAGTYGTAGSTFDKLFGQGIKISSLERANNLEILYGLGYRGGLVSQEKQFSGSISVEGKLSNPYVFRAILGNGGSVEAIDTGTPGDTTVDVENNILDRTIGTSATTNFTVNDWVRIQTGGDIDNTEYLQIESIDTGVSLTFNSPLMYVHPVADTVEEWNTTLGSGPYIHTFTEMNTAPSLTIQNSYDLATDKKVLFEGCTCTGATVSCAVNEIVDLKLDFDYADEVLSSTAYISQTMEDEDVFTFAHGALKVYAAGAWTTLSVVQNCEISINPNPEILYGLGSRKGVDMAGKQFEYDISASMMFQDTASLQELFYTGVAASIGPGNVSAIALELNLDNGQAGTANRDVTFQFANVKIDTDSLPQDPTAVIMEDVSMKATTMSVWGTNNTAAIP